MSKLYPEKIYLELTTRCNLRCRMCVKYASGSRIVEEDLPFAALANLEFCLGQVKTLILNGIGESLLHPDLEAIIRFARRRMAVGSRIGFQSNGVLLTAELSRRLISAGLSTICLSLDSIAEKTEAVYAEHSVADVHRALAGLATARKESGASSFRIGLEMVLTRENLAELPRYVCWAAERGVNYIIVTHLFQYTSSSAELSLFNPNSTDAVQLFHRWDELAGKNGLDIRDYPSIFMKYKKNKQEMALVELVRQMQKEARDKNIYLHLQSLLQHRKNDTETVENSFTAARDIARKNGVELFLPPIEALSRRKCAFIEEEAVFIAAGGAVMPCHFLWHTYSCRVFDNEVQVRHYSFGDIIEQPLEQIWQSPEYGEFRREAGEYGYSSCWSCSQGPCADLINDNIHAANDCYGSQVPCGHCQWNLGGIHCL
jgi:putative metalloenzyme radical SAM/SPASM domain maturase